MQAVTLREEPGLLRAVGIALLTAAGSAALFPMWQNAWTLWSEDPLRSIGAIFPIIALLLVLWRWRRLQFRGRGSYWGLLLIALSILGARVFDAATFNVTLGGQRWGLLHPGMVLFCYGIGCTLLFGGVPLLRRAIFPLCLLLLINPVPRFFNTVVDLPLQQLGAGTARAFSHLIGLRPTGEQLKMMFAPDFGMMIVPGCNGVRGSITLGYLALIFGYTRGLSAKALAVLTTGAFLMGYVLNLIRLCTLVIYYKVGLSWIAIQKYGVEIDYVIGCTIFLFATLGIGLAVRFYQLREGSGEQAPPALPASPATGFALRALCFAALILVFLIPQARAINAARHTVEPTAADVLAALPKQVGRYTLTRTWTEGDTARKVNIVLGEYRADDVKDGRFTLGLWIGGGNHFVANSKLYRDVHPQWTGAFEATAASSLPVRFIGSFYDDGVNRSYDAETACIASGCRENLVMDPKTGIVFSSPDLAELAVARSTRRLPILLRREWTDATVPQTAQRAEFEADARDFVAHLQIQPLVQSVGH
ncbi:exosortase J [Granulicella rosea]|uniref:Exosortase J n=2 Tax=Granulicella rosea TaxID=474952 RepID=A0A239H1N5_9BACT|nr:exosortase J [Granulicella rosea]